MDYSGIIDNVADNGEPGLCWLDNMQKFGRMKDTANYKDSKALGANPCLE